MFGFLRVEMVEDLGYYGFNIVFFVVWIVGSLGFIRVELFGSCWLYVIDFFF